MLGRHQAGRAAMDCSIALALPFALTLWERLLAPFPTGSSTAVAAASPSSSAAAARAASAAPAAGSGRASARGGVDLPFGVSVSVRQKEGRRVGPAEGGSVYMSASG